MPEGFDPYRKWLGIPPAEQPPHHYRLLGIGLFEDDPDVIESAADQRMAHLRTFQGGAHSALSQKLLNEIAAAKVCLMAADRRAAYDAELRARLEPPKPGANRPLPVAKPAPPAAAEPAALIVTESPIVTRARPKQKTSSPVVWWSAGVAALAVLALGAYLVWGRAEPRSIAGKPSSNNRGPAEALRTDASNARQPGGSSSNRKPANEPAGQASAGDVPQTETTAPAENKRAAMPDSSADDKTAAPGESAPPRAMAPFDPKQARAYQETWAAHLKTPVEQKNSLGMPLILIPPGEFTMGSTPEQIAAAKKQGEQVQEGAVKWALEHIEAEAPAHRVKISRPFLMSATEVTIGQYRRFVEATSYVTETERFGGGSSTSLNEQDLQKKSFTWRSLSVPADDDSAVGQITWNDAVAFCNWLSETEKKRRCYREDDRGEWTLAPSGDGYRLPTEAEWEFACRAGTTTQFSYGDDASAFGEYGSSETVRSMSFPNAAGSKAPNRFGLYDMHANADEWCHDWYSPNYYAESPAEDPAGPAAGHERIRRGGGWNNPLVLNRSAFRGSYAPFWRFGGLGFRVVCVSTTVPKIAPVELQNSLGMPLVLIPPGEFTMGSTPEQIAAAKKFAEQERQGDVKWTLERIETEAPAHQVKVSRPFLIGATEVTVGQYRRFVEAASYVTETERFGGGHSMSKEEQDPKKKTVTWRTPGYPVADESAVSQITWNDAVAFCNWLSEREKLSSCYRGDERGDWTISPAGDGYRLPAEAEWEYACRAGTTTQYSFGDDASTFGEYGWWSKVGSAPNANPVGRKLPNPFGLYDMHGNVDEWCHDWFSPDYYAQSPPDDPTGPASGADRIRRGGALGWPIVRSRSAFRGSYPPYYRFSNLGFRVVRVSTAAAIAPDSLAASAEKPKPKQPTEMPKPEPSGKKPRSLGDLAGEGKGKTSSESEGRLAAAEAFTLQQHTGAVTRVAFHPFLPLLASGGKDGQVLLWDLEKKTLLGQFDDFKEEVWTVKFSPDGNVLTYANRYHWGSVVPFKVVATAKEIKRLKDFKFGGGAVGSIAYSPDGAFFAAGQDDGTIRLWETGAFLETSPLSVGSDVNSLVFGPITFDRKRKPAKYLLAAGCKDGSIKTLDLEFVKDKDGARWTFALGAIAFPKLAGVLCARFSPDGKLLASGRFGGLISLLDPQTGKSIRDMKASNANIDWLAFHPERPWLVAAHWQDRRARIWNYDTGEILCELPGHTGGVFCAEFSRDGRRVATASDDFSIKVWDLNGPGVPPLSKRPKKGKAAAPIVGD